MPADEPVRELGTSSRVIVTVARCAFVAASAATVVCFAFIDPEALRDGEAPAWWADRPTVYAIGFFFFWLTAALASALTVYLVRPERTQRQPRPRDHE